MSRCFKITLFCICSVLTAGSARAQQSHCADCHFANPSAPRRDHLNEWDRSPHGRNNIGCEWCHGGNPKVFEDFLAHRGVLNAFDKASPVNPRNQPATCGRCHVGALVAADGQLLSPKSAGVEV